LRSPKNLLQQFGLEGLVPNEHVTFGL